MTKPSGFDGSGGMAPLTPIQANRPMGQPMQENLLKNTIPSYKTLHFRTKKILIFQPSLMKVNV